MTVACSIGATVLLVAPVSMHRLLFRRHRLDAIVSASHGFAIVGTGAARRGPQPASPSSSSTPWSGRTGRLDRRRLHTGGTGRFLVRDAAAGRGDNDNSY